MWCKNTTELLAARLRTGNAGANTTTDHLEVLAAAITQIPRAHRKNLLIRADGAGASHGLLDWLTAQNPLWGRRVDYSIGFALTDKLRAAIMLVPATVWRSPPSVTNAKLGSCAKQRSPASGPKATCRCCRLVNSVLPHS